MVASWMVPLARQGERAGEKHQQSESCDLQRQVMPRSKLQQAEQGVEQLTRHVAAADALAEQRLQALTTTQQHKLRARFVFLLLLLCLEARESILQSSL